MCGRRLNAAMSRMAESLETSGHLDLYPDVREQAVLSQRRLMCDGDGPGYVQRSPVYDFTSRMRDILYGYESVSVITHLAWW